MSSGYNFNESAMLNDLVARLGWHRHGLRFFPTRKQDEVIAQYVSADGGTRSVICNPLKMDIWIRKNKAVFGAYTKLISLFDLKEDHDHHYTQKP